MHRTVQLLLFALLAILPAASQAATHRCLVTTALVEQREQLPRGLLYAIALTESGRWSKEQNLSHAWPWTIRSKADGFVVDSKQEAVNIVQRLQQEGRKNIDVGCMQVNLRYHPDAFPDLEVAFEPYSNVVYAAQFLKQLRAEGRSWQRAIEWYHSRDPVRGKAYRKRVYGHWRTAQAKINQAHQALARTGWREAAAIALIDGNRTPSVGRNVSIASNGQSARLAHASSLVNTAAVIEVHRGQNTPVLGSEQTTNTAELPDPVQQTRPGAIRPNAGRALHGVDIVRPGQRISGFFKPIR